MSTKISRPRIMRSKNDRPLNLDEIRGCAPAVFQEAPYHTMSPSYAYIPTIAVLERLLDAGFQVHEVAQTRPYAKDRDPFAKHMLRLRYPAKEVKIGAAVPELVLINAHDGTARYYLYAGVYRFICCNGMIVGDTFAKIVVAHRGGDITKGRVLEGSYEIVDKEMPRVMSMVDDMQARILKREEQAALAQIAWDLRAAGTQPSYQPADLLSPRREEDKSNDLWTVFNRIQENTMQGGMQGRSMLFTRRSIARPIERVNQLVSINRKLWDAAAGLLS